MEVPKEGVKDECQEEDSQMPAECQEKDSQMPAEEERIPEEVPSSADTLHLGSGACGASPADVSADTGIPFGIGKPAFQGKSYWSCAAEGKGANGVVTAYVFKSAFSGQCNTR